MRRRTRQLTLALRTWGGRRPGAGRKPAGPRPRVRHRSRSPHAARHPLLVTLRAVPGLPSLRSSRVFFALRHSLGASSCTSFRIVQFTAQSNHVHLLAEADSASALARGMQGLGVRLARAANRMLGRCGRVWSDRYHARTLRTPAEVRNALVYVLMNGRKHGVTGRGIDTCSSGPWFDGWRDAIELRPGPAPVARARTWLLGVGWRRRGLIGVRERPGGTAGFRS